jgi:hypothetical protein
MLLLLQLLLVLKLLKMLLKVLLTLLKVLLMLLKELLTLLKMLQKTLLRNNSSISLKIKEPFHPVKRFFMLSDASREAISFYVRL